MASVGLGDEVVLTGADLQLFDDEDAAADLIYELTDDVDFGTLYLSDTNGNRIDLDVGDTFSQADIDLGMLSYEQDDSLAHFWDPETPEWGDGGGPVDQSNLTMPLEAQAVTITFQGEEAGYENSLGWYKLDAEGNPTEPQILWTNTDHNSLSEGTEVTLQGLAPGEQFGFFIIQDGNDEYSWLNSQVQSGNTMQFGEDGSLQFVDGGGNVAQSVSDNDLFYTGSSHNPDGINHAISGVQDGELLIGFEDLTGGGDNDFDDVVFSVKYEGVDGPQTATSDSFTFTAEDSTGATVADHTGHRRGLYRHRRRGPPSTSPSTRPDRCSDGWPADSGREGAQNTPRPNGGGCFLSVPNYRKVLYSAAAWGRLRKWAQRRAPSRLWRILMSAVTGRRSKRVPALPRRFLGRLRRR